MGCDIHLCVEVNKEGQWTSVDVWEYEEVDYVAIPYRKRFYDERNYKLFAMLANVRNNFGFAGCDLGDNLNPIVMPRGLPIDVTPEVRLWSDQWGVDGHSHSYLTVAELLAYDWLQIATLRGVVSAVEYWHWQTWESKHNGHPSAYAGDVWGGQVEVVSEDEMKARIEKAVGESSTHPLDIIKTVLPHTYCRIQWQQPYYDLASDFWGTCMPRLLALGKPEHVRIVFWFDN